MAIHLFAPFFTPSDLERRRELDACLHRNATNPAFASITLMVDDDSQGGDYGDHVRTVRFADRPTYADWAALSQQLPFGDVSLLANADIFFDETILRLEDLFVADPYGFLALSRYEWNGGNPRLHPNPHWSQDVWGFVPSHNPNADRDRQLQFQLGVPRCDNRVAYIFAVHGHAIYNPCQDIRTFHVHASGVRSYNKKLDRRIVGGMAMVHASAHLHEPAKLDLEIWPVRSADIQGAKINRSLEKWLNEAAASGQTGLDFDQQDLVLARQGSTGSVMRRRAQADLAKPTNAVISKDGLIAYDEDWQFPAITEKHAFMQMQLVNPTWDNAVYAAFPWATLIDLIRNNSSATKRIAKMREGLGRIRELASGSRRVVTVCQHIRLKEYASLLLEAGITDVFWSHAVLGEQALCEGKVQVHPFPLYPVQTVEQPPPFDDRPLLFSFVGARPSKDYLTRSRQHIIDHLSDDPQGKVIDRTHWHYNRVVYDAQILNKVGLSEALISNSDTQEFLEVMAASKFALCPSGTGPNSIRLWEAICSDVIPVILSDTHALPGPQDLWRAAAVFCGEAEEEVQALPGRLRTYLADEEGMATRQAALKTLRARYGRGWFICDLVAFLRAPFDYRQPDDEIAVDLLQAASWAGHSFALSSKGLEIDRNGRSYDGQATATVALKPGVYRFEIEVTSLTHRLEIGISDQNIAATAQTGTLAFEHRVWADQLVINLRAAGANAAKVTASRIVARRRPDVGRT